MVQMNSLPTLLLWQDSALYIGPGFDAELHHHHALQLCVAMEQPLKFRAAMDADWQHASAVAINADQPHELQCQGALAVLFIAAESELQLRIAPQWFRDAGLAAISIDVDRLRSMVAAGAELQCKQGAAIRAELLSVGAQENTLEKLQDVRVTEAIAYIHEHLEAKVSAELLAREVNLSADHLMTLFRKHSGLSIRQFVLWARIRRATEAVVSGMSLTEAAHEAGFTDSAHFTHSFRSTFGLPPNLLNLIAQQGRLGFCES